MVANRLSANTPVRAKLLRVSAVDHVRGLLAIFLSGFSFLRGALEVSCRANGERHGADNYLG